MNMNLRKSLEMQSVRGGSIVGSPMKGGYN